MTFNVPQGFRLAGVHCGIKRNPQKEDLTLVVSDGPAVAAGTYTTNLVCAAPVTLDRRRTPGDQFRVIVANSGCANACTGDEGDRNAARMAQLAAQAVHVQENEALVLSTGVIGSQLPMDRIASGITAAAGRLGRDEAALVSAARGILTTDTAQKLAARTLPVGGRTVQITGLAKGAGMIGPKMATMLSIVLTDARLAVSAAQQTLSDVVDETFNCISVDGHMSTNDTVLLLASGAAGGAALGGQELRDFRAALAEVCGELGRAIVSDGEGATHLISIDVEGCASCGNAQAIARTIADSPLVKTAIAGADPNWGRIVSAAGYAGVRFDPHRVSLSINGTLLYAESQPVAFDAQAVSQSIRSNRETRILLRLGEGDERVRFWTSDLTAEYVRINADYHT